VRASLIDEIDGEIYQYPAGAYQVQDLQPQFKDFEKETMGYTHPIMRRKVDGLTRFVKWQAGRDSLDILVRYAEAPGAEKQVLGLILDRKWILDRIPAFMDSLARENPMVLFWSKCPPDLAEQCLGVTYGSDTLWWQGDRSLQIPLAHPSGLIEDLKVHPRYHWIKGDKEVADHMPGVRRWFASAEILGIVLVVLAFFAMRPRKQN
jgi:hypothetical protein